MDARHCAGADMADLMAYGAYVGSKGLNQKLMQLGLLDVQQTKLHICLKIQRDWDNATCIDRLCGINIKSSRNV